LQGQLELFQGHCFSGVVQSGGGACVEKVEMSQLRQSSVGKGLRRVFTPARMAALPCAS
jgi:hypothetical protein